MGESYRRRSSNAEVSAPILSAFIATREYELYIRCRVAQPRRTECEIDVSANRMLDASVWPSRFLRPRTC